MRYRSSNTRQDGTTRFFRRLAVAVTVFAIGFAGPSVAVDTVQLGHQEAVAADGSWIQGWYWAGTWGCYTSCVSSNKEQECCYDDGSGDPSPPPPPGG